jgi:hypothetical protein
MPRSPAGRPPPHDLDAEAAVLSTLLLDVRRLGQVQLRPADFYSEANGRIYAAIHELAADAKSVDTVTVAGLLRDRGKLASIGGAAYLAQIVDATPSVANVAAHAERVATMARRRRVIDRAHLIAAEGYGDVAEGWEHEAARSLAEVAEPAPAPVQAPDPIRSAWRPIGRAALDIRPEPRRWLLRHPTKDWAPCDPTFGDGMLPLGKAGLLAAEGGAGKTAVLIQLAICVVTARRWLGHFVIGHEAQGRRVALALAEEDLEEVGRRMFEACDALGLDEVERELVAEQVMILPLAGEPVALLESEPYGGAIRETPALASLRSLLSDPEHPLALVVLDPLARWAGVDAESDSRIATRLIQAVESLTRCPGGPAVLVAHHSSKLARRAGDVDARGVTAITDGLRWAGTLRADGEAVMFRQSKSNYSRPMPHELRLVRGAGGVLRASAPEDAEDRARAQLSEAGRAMDADVARVVAALAAEGSASSVDGIAGLAGMRLTSGRRAVRLAVDRGLIVRSGTSREPLFRVCAETPIPPGTSGRPDGVPDETSHVRGFGVRDVEGRRRDVGTSSHWTERADHAADVAIVSGSEIETGGSTVGGFLRPGGGKSEPSPQILKPVCPPNGGRSDRTK